MTNLTICRIGDEGLSGLLIHANDIARTRTNTFFTANASLYAFNGHGTPSLTQVAPRSRGTSILLDEIGMRSKFRE